MQTNQRIDTMEYPAIGTPKVGGPSPWGRIQHVAKLAPGIWNVSTASHGGIYLASYRVDEMPANARISPHWYEEDCEAAVVLLHHWEAVEHNWQQPTLTLAGVRQTVERWNPLAA